MALLGAGALLCSGCHGEVLEASCAGEAGPCVLDAGEAEIEAGPRCTAPDAATYSCTPGPVDAGCAEWNADGGTPSYPIGCVVSLPHCSAFSGETAAQTCNCEVDTAFGPSPGWICPL